MVVLKLWVSGVLSGFTGVSDLIARFLLRVAGSLSGYQWRFGFRVWFRVSDLVR